jgi:ATP-binding cassette subfamily B protein
VFQRLAYLWPFLRTYRRKLIPGLLAILASVVVGLASPLLVGRAIDSLRTEVRSGTLLGYAALLVCITLVQGIFSYLQRLILVGMSRDIEYDLRNRYFSSLEAQPPAFFQEHPPAT